MKFVLFAFLLTASTSVLAQANCFTIQDSIDRKYCIDKYLQTLKTKLNADKKAWGASLAANVKADKLAATQSEMQMKKDQIGLINSELSLYDQHLADLNGMKETVAVAAPKKEKKKEKKKLFGIKL